MNPRARSVALMLLLPLFASLAQASPPAPPRAISEAERVAVEAAYEYLKADPRGEAFWSQLATESPLRKLGKEQALKEITARAGPPFRAKWELQTVVPSLKDRTVAFTISFPSGTDETLILDFVEESGVPKIQNIRVLAEPTPGVAAPESTTLATTAAVTGTDWDTTRTIILLLGLLGVACVIGAGAYVPPAPTIRIVLRGQTPPPPQKSRMRFLPPILALAGLALIGSGVAAAVLKDPRFSTYTPVATEEERPEESFERLANLIGLRAALAEGKDVEEIYQRLGAKGGSARVAALWRAQYALQMDETDEVEKILKEFPSPSNVPLAEILRGRLAFFRAKEVDAVIAYERAINLGPGRDALFYEAAQVLTILGFDSEAQKYLDRLARIGPRDPDVFYTLAMHAAADNEVNAAEDLLRRAWQMRPVERAELIETAVLWEVLRRDSVASLIKLSSAEEPRFASPQLSARPLDVARGANHPRVSGDFLHFTVGEQELLVPGGAALAPPDSPIVDAAEWARSEEERALRDLNHLKMIAQNPAAFSQRDVGERIENTANALANHNRWTELVELTDGISPDAENVATELFFLRGTALQRTRRLPEAKQLYAQLAVSRALQRKNDAQTLLMLGEMLHSVEMYDVAIKLMERAGRIRNIPYLDERLAQVSMNQRLATAYDLHATPNFDIRFPRESSRQQAEFIGTILEAEFTRMKKFIPLSSFERVTVNVMPWQDFRNVYTGSDHILGFYNGKITLPFAGVPVFVPEVVAILSHELSHAMLAQSTGDNAPRWFQEGLAQRLQMEKYSPNAFNMYDDDKLFSVAVLDAVMRGSPDPGMMQEAYIESQTLIRFIESKYGWNGIIKMIQAYREGANTDQAIMKLASQQVPQFDLQLRAWGRAESRVFENPDPIRYDRRWDEIIEFRKSSEGSRR